MNDDFEHRKYHRSSASSGAQVDLTHHPTHNTHVARLRMDDLHMQVSPEFLETVDAREVREYLAHELSAYTENAIHGALGVDRDRRRDEHQELLMEFLSLPPHELASMRQYASRFRREPIFARKGEEMPYAFGGRVTPPEPETPLRQLDERISDFAARGREAL